MIRATRIDSEGRVGAHLILSEDTAANTNALAANTPPGGSLHMGAHLDPATQYVAAGVVLARPTTPITLTQSSPPSWRVGDTIRVGPVTVQTSVIVDGTEVASLSPGSEMTITLGGTGPITIDVEPDFPALGVAYDIEVEA